MTKQVKTNEVARTVLKGIWNDLESAGGNDWLSKKEAAEAKKEGKPLVQESRDAAHSKKKSGQWVSTFEAHEEADTRFWNVIGDADDKSLGNLSEREVVRAEKADPAMGQRIRHAYELHIGINRWNSEDDGGEIENPLSVAAAHRLEPHIRSANFVEGGNLDGPAGKLFAHYAENARWPSAYEVNNDDGNFIAMFAASIVPGQDHVYFVFDKDSGDLVARGRTELEDPEVIWEA